MLPFNGYRRVGRCCPWHGYCMPELSRSGMKRAWQNWADEYGEEEKYNDGYVPEDE